MAYDRYDTRDTPRDERSRWSDDDWRRERDRARSSGTNWRASDGGRPEDRGFWDRASDEVASWFGDEEAERRRRYDQMRDERERGWSSRDQDRNPDRGERRDWDRDRERERGRRDWFATRGMNERGGFGEGDYNPSWRTDLQGPINRERDWDGFRNRDRDQNRERFSDRGRDYRPYAGDYGRSDSDQSPWGRDEYRRSSRAGTADWSDRSRHEDPHYESWRQRHMSELDRDYDDYRRENQSRFESDFGNWREQRMRKRELLGRIREHMEVVGNDGEHVGTIDRVAGDRLILTKSDPESGGVHHSLSCSDLDRIEGDKIILDCSADQARTRWRDESRSRALFEREDQGEMGPRSLDRSFAGTYRDR